MNKDCTPHVPARHYPQPHQTRHFMSWLLQKGVGEEVAPPQLGQQGLLASGKLPTALVNEHASLQPAQARLPKSRLTAP